VQGDCYQAVDHGSAWIRTLIEHRVPDTADPLDGGLPILTGRGDERPEHAHAACVGDLSFYGI
jgi:hypothetical protein